MARSRFSGQNAQNTNADVEKWHKARFQVKMYKARHAQTNFGSLKLQNVTRLWRKVHLQVKMYKTPQHGTDFATYDLERIMARRCGAKHICKSICEKTDGHAPLFEPPMSKTKHTALAQSTCKLKCAKYRCFGAFFEVQMSKN